MAIRLSEIEARVLGVLIEKSMTQLDTYPPHTQRGRARMQPENQS